MIAFWAVAGVLSAAAAILLLARAARAGAAEAPADPGPALYRRQLSEIGELSDRGLLGEAERRAAEAEAGRRLLADASRTGQPWINSGGRRAILAASIAAPALAVAVYLIAGSPGMGDQPYDQRLKHWQAVPPELLTPPEIAAVITAQLRQQPSPEGYRFLAIAQNAAGQRGEAIRALHQAIKLAPERADLREMLGIALVDQAGGELTADATEAFAQVLKRDPRSLTGRFYLAQAKMKAGRMAEGLADWKALLADLPADNPNRAPLQAAIAQAEGRPPAAQAAPPPTLDAIRGMVAGLAARLKSQPEDPEGWVRLVRAYAVLGDAESRDGALAAARARYAKDPQVLRALSEAARAEPMR